MSDHADQLMSARAFAFVSDHLGVTPKELKSKSRVASLVTARALFVWIIRTYRSTASYPEIGRMLGDRDHTTIMHLWTKACMLTERDPDFRLLSERFAAEERHGGGLHACA
ncbi:hypothetical protein IT881_15085 [Erythrobacter sp. A30-3]|nr:hypothetical protein IT881_15085 [Erythrobacter sp. A30-3]